MEEQIGLLVVLAGALAACGAPQLAIFRRATGADRRRALGSMLIYLSILLVFSGAVIRGAWGETGQIKRRPGDTFYQSNYNPGDLSRTSLQVARDPGAPVVYAGFTLMIAGIVVAFYLNPWLEWRRTRS